MIAPPHARETIAGFLGDVRFTTAGSDSMRVQTGGGFLAAEYVRRAVVAGLRPRRVDVAIAASHFLPDAAVIRAAARRGAQPVAFVYHLVQDRTDRSLRTRWSRMDERLALRLLRRCSTTIFTSNTETAQALSARGFAPLHTDVGLDVGAFERGAPGEAPPVALFVARLVPKKGLLDLLSVWRSVLERVPESKLVVVGSGPEREAGEALAAELGIGGSVDWRGFVAEDEKRRLLARARVFVAPSYEEGWGISVAEAMASALPVVAYRLPTLDEVFGDTYIPVPVGDVDRLADEVTRLLLDPTAASELGARGAEHVARYDLDVIADAELSAILQARERR